MGGFSGESAFHNEKLRPRRGVSGKELGIRRLKERIENGRFSWELRIRKKKPLEAPG